MPCHLLKCVYGKCVLYQRYVLIIMMQLALLNAYHMRVVLNIAITEMVDDRNLSSKVDACPEYTYERVPRVEGGTFHWNNDAEAGILYAFFCSYFISHIPGGWLADRFGGRHVMGICMIVSSIVTILMPIGIQIGGSWGAIILRFMLGLAQGPLLPTISTFIQCWVPKNQRAFLGGLAYGGSNMGTVTGSIFTGMMIKAANSWMMPFYVWGFASLAYCFFYYLFVFSNPQSHPFITDAEKEYLEQEIVQQKRFKVPWWKLCKSLPVWSLVAGQFSHNFIFFIVLTDLPKYLKEILKMNVQANAVTTALPFLALWVSNILFAYFADVVTNHEWLKPITARKIYTSFACIVPSTILIIIVYIGCNRLAVQILITLAFFMIGPYFSGMKVNVNDITIHYGGTIMAMVNGLGSFAGLIGPYMVGVLTVNESIQEWQICMWILFITDLVLSIIFVLFAEAERQTWDFVEE